MHPSWQSANQHPKTAKSSKPPTGKQKSGQHNMGQSLHPRNTNSYTSPGTQSKTLHMRSTYQTPQSRPRHPAVTWESTWIPSSDGMATEKRSKLEPQSDSQH